MQPGSAFEDSNLPFICIGAFLGPQDSSASIFEGEASVLDRCLKAARCPPPGCCDTQVPAAGLLRRVEPEVI